MFIYTRTCAHIHTYTYVHTYIHTYIHIYITLHYITLPVCCTQFVPENVNKNWPPLYYKPEVLLVESPCLVHMALVLHPNFLRPFFCNIPCHCTPLSNLRHVIFYLMLFGWQFCCSVFHYFVWVYFFIYAHFFRNTSRA